MSASSKAKGLGIVDDVLDRLQLGHVLARLDGHGQAQIVGRQAALGVGTDRATHRAFTPVVRGQRQIPVAEFGVELLQIVERAVGCRDHVTPLVEPPVLLQAEMLAGRRNELPDAGGAAARIGHRVVCALDHRQQRDFGRHAALLDFADDVVEIAATAFDHPRHVVRTRRVPRFGSLDLGGIEIRQHEPLPNARPQIAVLGLQRRRCRVVAPMPGRRAAPVRQECRGRRRMAPAPARAAAPAAPDPMTCGARSRTTRERAPRLVPRVRATRAEKLTGHRARCRDGRGLACRSSSCARHSKAVLPGAQLGKQRHRAVQCAARVTLDRGADRRVMHTEERVRSTFFGNHRR